MSSPTMLSIIPTYPDNKNRGVLGGEFSQPCRKSTRNNMAMGFHGSMGLSYVWNHHLGVVFRYYFYLTGPTQGFLFDTLPGNYVCFTDTWILGFTNALKGPFLFMASPQEALGVCVFWRSRDQLRITIGIWMNVNACQCHQHDLSKEPCMIACILIISNQRFNHKLDLHITSTHTSGFLLVVSFFFITNEEKQQQQPEEPTSLPPLPTFMERRRTCLRSLGRSNERLPALGTHSYMKIYGRDL